LPFLSYNFYKLIAIKLIFIAICGKTKAILKLRWLLFYFYLLICKYLFYYLFAFLEGKEFPDLSFRLVPSGAPT